MVSIHQEPGRAQTRTGWMHLVVSMTLRASMMSLVSMEKVTEPRGRLQKGCVKPCTVAQGGGQVGGGECEFVGGGGGGRGGIGEEKGDETLLCYPELTRHPIYPPSRVSHMGSPVCCGAPAMRLGQGRAGPHLGLRLCKGLRLCLGAPLGCCHPLRRGPTIHVTGAVRAVVILRLARHPAGCRECEATWELARGRRGERGACTWKWGAAGYSNSLPSGGGCRLCSWLALDHRRSFAHRGPCFPSPLKVAVLLTTACRVQDTAAQAAEWG